MTKVRELLCAKHAAGIANAPGISCYVGNMIVVVGERYGASGR